VYPKVAGCHQCSACHHQVRAPRHRFFWHLVSEESTFVAPLPYIHLHCLCPW
jgi:hypothetical protein